MNTFVNILNKFTYVKSLLSDIDRLSSNLTAELDRNKALSEKSELLSSTLNNGRDADPVFVPSGHYYSPLPSIQEIKEHEREIFDEIPRTIASVDLNEKEQLNLVEHFAEYYQELPYCIDNDLLAVLKDLLNQYYSPGAGEEAKRSIVSSYQEMLKNKDRGNLRFFYENASFGFSDGIALFCMIRHVKPRRIIEVGSGYSSCLMLDVNELFFDKSIQCTFIDPYPDSLLSLIRDEDEQRISIIQSRVQDLNLDLFSSLESGDILFIDSTHVSKVGSDVNHIFFNILPSLQNGVLIHFHDIFYPFEYPKQWIFEGRAWNECYILRTFLQYNLSFKIVFYASFMKQFHEDLLRMKMPIFTVDSGSSIWLQKK